MKRVYQIEIQIMVEIPNCIISELDPEIDTDDLMEEMLWEVIRNNAEAVKKFNPLCQAKWLHTEIFEV